MLGIPLTGYEWLPGSSAHPRPSSTKASGVRSCSLKGSRGDSPWQSHCPPLCPEGELLIPFPGKISIMNHLWSEGFQSLITHFLEIPGHLSTLSLFLPVSSPCVLSQVNSLICGQAWPLCRTLSHILQVFSNLH